MQWNAILCQVDRNKHKIFRFVHQEAIVSLSCARSCWMVAIDRTILNCCDWRNEEVCEIYSQDFDSRCATEGDEPTSKFEKNCTKPFTLRQSQVLVSRHTNVTRRQKWTDCVLTLRPQSSGTLFVKTLWRKEWDKNPQYVSHAQRRHSWNGCLEISTVRFARTENEMVSW